MEAFASSVPQQRMETSASLGIQGQSQHLGEAKEWLPERQQTHLSSSGRSPGD